MKAQVFFSMDEARGRCGPCAITIGSFDGVHLGHQTLLAATRKFAADRQVNSAVLTFHPHPTVFVAPHRVPPLICSLEERIRLLGETGVDRILVLPFSQELALFTPEQFVAQVLVKELHSKAIVVGENFRFGHRQAGTPDTLKQLGGVYEFEANFIQSFTLRGQVVSSSAIRQHLTNRKVSLAGRMLGRCFSLTGPVVKGRGVGSTQTVPTLNIEPPAGQLVPRGVYVTETLEAATGRRWPSITNAGVRPTFGGDELSVETFLLAPLAGPSPEQIQVFFRRFVRAEQTFPDPASLKVQILRDVALANKFWRRVPAR